MPWTPQTTSSSQPSLPVPALCILKTVKPGHVIEHGLVTEVEEADKTATLQWMRRKGGKLGPGQEQVWVLWPTAGHGSYERVVVGWNDLLDRILEVAEVPSQPERTFRVRQAAPLIRDD